MEYEIRSCTRRCAATDRELAPGEAFYSVLVQQGAELVRKDYSEQGWQGPPEGAIGWWKSRMPDPRTGKPTWAPNDVMLDLLEQLAEQPEKADMRFVLALLLVRRRVVRHDESLCDPQGGEVMVLCCPRRQTTYRVPVVMPDEARTQQIQDELAKLLFTGAT